MNLPDSRKVAALDRNTRSDLDWTKPSFVQVKHMRERDIPACHDIQLAGFQADWTFVFFKPPE